MTISSADMAVFRGGRLLAQKQMRLDRQVGRRGHVSLWFTVLMAFSMLSWCGWMVHSQAIARLPPFILSDDRPVVVDHPATAQLFAMLKQCEKAEWRTEIFDSSSPSDGGALESQPPGCPVVDLLQLAGKICNDYSGLLLQDKAQNVLEDILYFVGSRHKLIEEKVCHMLFVINLSQGQEQMMSRYHRCLNMADSATLRTVIAFKLLSRTSSQSFVGTSLSDYTHRLESSLLQTFTEVVNRMPLPVNATVHGPFTVHFAPESLSTTGTSESESHSLEEDGFLDEGEEELLSFLFSEIHGVVRFTPRVSDSHLIFYPSIATYSSAQSMSTSLTARVAVGLSKLGLNDFATRHYSTSSSPWEDRLLQLRARLILHAAYSSQGALVAAINRFEYQIEQVLMQLQQQQQQQDFSSSSKASGGLGVRCTSLVEIASTLQALPLLQLSGLSAPREGSVLGHSPIPYTQLLSDVYSALCTMHSIPSYVNPDLLVRPTAASAPSLTTSSTDKKKSQTKKRSSVAVPQIRVGVVSGSLDGLHGRLIIGLLDALPSLTFRGHEIELISLCFPTAKSAVTERLMPLFSQHLSLPDNKTVATERLRSVRADLLLFIDANLDPRVFALAHERSAPLQAAYWGWGGTVGVPSLDYYFVPEFFVNEARCPRMTVPRGIRIQSESSLQNNGNSNNHNGLQNGWLTTSPGRDSASQERVSSFFREQLIMLDGYPSLPRVAPVSNEELRAVMKSRYLIEVSNKTNIYLFPAPAKHLHPEFDKAVEIILKTDPLAIFVVAVPRMARDMIPTAHMAVRHDVMHPSVSPAVISRIKRRFDNLLRDQYDRVRFLPPLEESVFRALQLNAAVVLDSFPVGLQVPMLEAYWDNAPVLTAPALQECIHSYAKSIGQSMHVQAYFQESIAEWSSFLQQQDAQADPWASISNTISLPTSAEEFGVLAVRIARDSQLKSKFRLPTNVNKRHKSNSRAHHFHQILDFSLRSRGEV